MLFLAVCALALLLIFKYLTGTRKWWRELSCGRSEISKMSGNPDAYFNSHQSQPLIRMPLAFVPSHVFLVSPELIKKFYTSSTLDSLETKRELSISVFGMPYDALPISSSRSMIITAVEKLYHSELAPSRVPDLCKRFQPAWSKQLRSEFQVYENTHLSIDLNERLYKMLFTAAVETFFGPQFPAEQCIGPIRKILSDLAGCVVSASFRWPLDRLAALLWGRTARSGAEELASLCEGWLATEGTSNACELVQRTEELVLQAGWTRKELVIMLSMLLFTLVANTSDAIGWAMTAILQSPVLLDSITKEAITCDMSMLQEVSAFSFLADQTPYLFSALHETLRIFNAPLSVRVAHEDTQLRKSSAPLAIPKGWRAVSMTRSINVDQSIWGQDASKFRGNRFHCKNAESRTRDMSPFGGGATICPGRHFALVELATAITSLLRLLRFDVSSMRVTEPNMYTIASPPLFDVVDADGTEIRAVWAGAVADPNGAQSGVFRAKHRTIVDVLVKP